MTNGSQVDFFRENGFLRFDRFFEKQEVERIRQDAMAAFKSQMISRGVAEHSEMEEADFERAMSRYFQEDLEGFVNCGKTCQHLISLHKLALSDKVVRQLVDLGLERPNICTRPVLFFNSKHLAKSEAHYKSPSHQDWRSMQGSLNAMVVWVPLADVPISLGALEIIPGSHLWGLQESKEDEWYRSIDGIRDDQYQSVEVKAGDALFFSAFLVHRSGNNVTDSIRWSCHFRYNDLAEPSFVQRKYPNPYVYKPQQELITPNFPTPDQLKSFFSAGNSSEAVDAAPIGIPAPSNQRSRGQNG